jgi:hypothetical protein
MSDVHVTIDRFRSDMLSAVSSEIGYDESMSQKVTNGMKIRNGTDSPYSLAIASHEVAQIWNDTSNGVQRNHARSTPAVYANLGDVASSIAFASEAPNTKTIDLDDLPKQSASYHLTTSHEVGEVQVVSPLDETECKSEDDASPRSEDGRIRRTSQKRTSTTSSHRHSRYSQSSAGQRRSVQSTSKSFEERSVSFVGRSRAAATTATTEQNYLQAASVDLDKEDEEDDPSGCCVKGVLNPNYPARLAWDLNTMFLVMCDAMILPYQMSFTDGESPALFDTIWLILTTTFFTIDIFMNFHTGYQAGARDTDCEPGRMVTKRRRIAKNYFRTWFGIDFVSTVPWGVMANLILGGGSGSAGQLGKLTKVIKFVRFMRLMRMLRLAKLAAIWEKVEARCGSVILIQGVALLRVLFVLVCICHWNACIWWMIGQEKSIITEMLSDEDQADWAKQPHWTTIQRSNGDGEPTWRWADRSTGEAYIFCFYWTLGVMRTMPAEVTPVSQPERMYVMIFMFFAFSAFAICVAMITQTFFKFSERKRIFNDDMAAVRMHLRKHKASEHLQLTIKTYVRHLYDTRTIAGREQNMLLNIPEHLKNDLQHIKFVPYLQKMKVFVNVSYRALQLVTCGTIRSASGREDPILECRNHAPGDVLSLKDNMAKAAWILVVGRLRIQAEEGEDEQDNQTLRVKISVVDEKTLATEQAYFSPLTVICQCACTCLRVDKERFFQKVEGNSMFWNSISARPSVSSSRSNMSRARSDGGPAALGLEPSMEGFASYADMFTETPSRCSTRNVETQAVETAAMTMS